MPLAEHDADNAHKDAVSLVSIHVPLAEHDEAPPSSLTCGGTFQFTCPSRSTTDIFAGTEARYEVSIHVPLAEHDGDGQD